MEHLIPYDFHFPPLLEVGYPYSGIGVWVLTYIRDSAHWNSAEPEFQPLGKLKPWGLDEKLLYILTMDERCEVLKEFGATFFEKVEDCPDIASNFEGAKRSAEHYGELLGKMEDREYFIKWVDEL